MMQSNNVQKALLRFVKIRKIVRNMSNQMVSCQEIRIPVPWGHVAGKWWGPTDVRPILTLHGWQDNCGSLDKLIPLLDEHAYLAIDLPGHGHSSWLPSGMFYHFQDYLVLCRYLKQYFGWPKISFMGHSLGGVISYCYSMLYPQDVDFVVAIDGLKPLLRKDRYSHMTTLIDRFLKFREHSDDASATPSYTIEEIKKKICKPNKNSISYEASDVIMARNISPSQRHPGKYCFLRDPRLKAIELSTFCQSELVRWANHVTTPIMLIKAIDAGYFEAKEDTYEVIDILKKVSRDFEMHYVKGSHHVHLNNPEVIADYVKNFIKKHNVEDRGEGGIKDEIIIGHNKQTSKFLY